MIPCNRMCSFGKQCGKPASHFYLPSKVDPPYHHFCKEHVEDHLEIWEAEIRAGKATRSEEEYVLDALREAL